jgi:hypothetical protein
MEKGKKWGGYIILNLKVFIKHSNRSMLNGSDFQEFDFSGHSVISQ